MSHIYTDAIQEETIEFANMHGFKLGAHSSNRGISPRDNSSRLGTIVGVDLPMPNTVRCQDGASDWVNIYCINELDCTSDDIIWELVNYTHVHNTGHFSIASSRNEWSAAQGHFIFIKKEDALRKFGNEMLTQAGFDKIKDCFSREIEEYSVWCRGEVYDLSITANENKPSGDVQCVERNHNRVYNTGKKVDDAAVELIELVMDAIDNDIENTVKLTLSTEKVSTPLPILVRLVISQIKHKFNFIPAIGTIDLLENESLISLNIHLNSMPSFMKLCVNTNTVGNLFQKVRKIATQDNGNELSQDDIISHLTNEKYKNWPSSLISALMLAISHEITEVEFVSAERLEDRAGIDGVMARFIETLDDDKEIQDLVTDVLDAVGGAKAFINKEYTGNHTNKASTPKQRVDLFSKHKSAFKKLGRVVASRNGYSGLLEYAADELSKYNHSIDDLSDAMHAPKASYPPKKGEDTQVSLAMWLTKIVFDYIHEHYLSFR